MLCDLSGCTWDRKALRFFSDTPTETADMRHMRSDRFLRLSGCLALCWKAFSLGVILFYDLDPCAIDRALIENYLFSFFFLVIETCNGI